MVNLLIPYIQEIPADPVLDEFTYGDLGARARKLKKDLREGDYVFFHTTLRGGRYITAYYVIDEVLDTVKVVENKAITRKYRNPHIGARISGEQTNRDDVIIFGDTVLSYKLKRPLPFDKNLANKLSLNIPFKNGKTENQCIGSATRAWRELTADDVQVLLLEIEENEKAGYNPDTIISSDEVMEILEADLENFIVRNSNLIGHDLTLVDRQMDIPGVGRIDLLYEDKNDTLIVVELKLNEIGTRALNQLRSYMSYFKTSTKGKVEGAIICKDIMPAFAERFKNLSDVKILCYGWRLSIFPRKWH